MGLEGIDKLLPALYTGYVDIVDDRLIKANRPLKRLGTGVVQNDQNS
jgi:hypothetical protein